jgi:transglutaminase-like putative cysteine protease
VTGPTVLTEHTRRYRIEHSTRYAYSDVVTASYGRGYLRPRDLPWQQCLSHRLEISPSPRDIIEHTDVFGNTDAYFQVTDNHRDLLVRSVAEVSVSRIAADPGAAGAPWESARPLADPEAVDFVLPSPQITLPDGVRSYAAVSFPPGRPLLEAISDLCTRIHADFEYTAGATTVSTSIDEVLSRREGVCQDFAHLAVACLRSAGLPGRYVSGYLATDPPPGKERMVGIDAGHAWAAVRLPDGDWLAFDPTNDQLADERYTTVAWGRDYADVPPLRGVIYSDADRSTMTVSVDVAPLE